jgi:autotransporter translocation and assembly factor TamB
MNIMASPDAFDAQLNCAGSNLRWDKKTIHQLEVQAEMKAGKADVQASVQFQDERASQLKFMAQILTESATDWNTCWHNLSASLDASIAQPEKIVSHITPWIETTHSLSEPRIEPLGGWPTGAIHLHGTAAVKQQQLGEGEAELIWQAPAWAGIHAKNIKLNSSWNPNTQQAVAKLITTDLMGSEINASGAYSLTDQTYSSELSIKSLDIAKLRPMLDTLNQTIPREGVVNLNWSGQGQIDDIHSHQGKINSDIAGLEVEAEGEPAMNINLAGHYDPGLNVRIDDLQVTRGKLSVKTMGEWKKETLRLETLELHDQESLLVHGVAQFPLSRDLSDLQTFLRQPGEINLNLKIDKMPLAEIYEQLPLANDPVVKGGLTLEFNLGGTLLEPTINLNLDAKRLKIVGKEEIPLTDISLKLETKEKTVHLNGSATPDGHKALVLKGNMPFKPKQWIDQPDSLLKEAIQASLDTKSIDLAAFTHLFPHISEISGSFSSIIKLSGTIADPQLQGNSRFKISRVKSTRESIPNMRDIDFRLVYDKDKLTIEPSSCLVAGGKYSLKGVVDFQELSNPVFDISLTADKALLWRDDAIIARSDAALKLSGPLEKANLSGDIGIVQSLFYKDIQIIPMGSGGSLGGGQRAKAELPSFTQASNKAGDTLDIPAPFSAWTLNLTAKTKDDFLIRGNLAKGNINGGLKVTGTLGNPQPHGKLTLREGQASLPFSRLHVKEGKVIFTPKHGFDPQLSIKATSKIGSYDVDITLYGLASNPKTLMTSRPPLPESEIIFLLATGSTSDQLSDRASATGKAYQLLADGVIRASPGRFKSIMNTIAELNGKVDINIGGTDPFTGRKNNSARVEITDRWHLVASMDLVNNTRGVVVYAIQFK